MQYYIPSAPPTAPSNLIASAFNATATLLSWEQPSVMQSTYLLMYNVLIINNRTGAVVYNKTVNGLKVIITGLNPCGGYNATVTAQYANLSCVGNGTDIVPFEGTRSKYCILNI